MLDSFQEQQLTGAGDTLLHYHLADRVPTHDTLVGLESVANVQTKTAATYTLTERDDFILADGGTLTIPLAKAGREFEIVMTGLNPVTVNLTSPDLVYGNSSVYISVQGTALRFKAITGGWIFI